MFGSSGVFSPPSPSSSWRHRRRTTATISTSQAPWRRPVAPVRTSSCSELVVTVGVVRIHHSAIHRVVRTLRSWVGARHKQGRISTIASGLWAHHSTTFPDPLSHSLYLSLSLSPFLTFLLFVLQPSFCNVVVVVVVIVVIVLLYTPTHNNNNHHNINNNKTIQPSQILRRRHN